jgi:hypothetical protein
MYESACPCMYEPACPCSLGIYCELMCSLLELLTASVSQWQPRLQTLYYSFIQTGSTNGANVPGAAREQMNVCERTNARQYFIYLARAVDRLCK